MVVMIAKDYHDSALNNLKAFTHAAFDLAKCLASDRASTDGGSHDHTTVLENAAVEIRAESFEFMKDNVITALEYAQELAGLTTAADFAELSGKHARKQCELMLKQASALKSLAQTIAKSDTDE